MADRLERYREMRDFRITPEPRGSGKKSPAEKKALAFYIQRHHATRLHSDFRLELEGTLKSWAVPKGPSLDPSVKRLAVQTEDHPLEYGGFEGTIPAEQYGAGDVLLWDQGTWIPEDADPVAALAKGHLHFELRGAKLQGRWILARTRRDEGKPSWLLMKRDDDEARDGDEAEITVLRPESVKKAPKAKKRAKKLRSRSKETWVPDFVAPMLATLVTEPPRAAPGQWVYEVKYDGYRMLARITKDGVSMFTRTGNAWTAKLPHLVKEIAALGLEDSLLDGEIVVPGEGGRSDFQALQNAFDRGSDARIVYYVFDAPYLEGQDLRALSLVDRKKRLSAALKKKHARAVRLSEHLAGDARDVLEQACKLGLEGLIGKQADSVYASGRSKAWIKLKCRRRQDFVIGGFTPPQGSRHGFGALLVGFYDARGKLQYAGKVGTGFNDDLLSSLSRKLAGLKRSDAPFANPPREKGVTWLQPKLVGEVAYAEKTKDGILRQAAFMGLREDISAKSVGEEKAVAPPANEPALKITHPDRLIWPNLKVSKLALVKYYEAVGDWILPHIKDRPLSLVRCPDGVDKPCFYQRHLLMGASPGHLSTVKREKKGRSAYIYASTLEGVLSAVQNGAVEFHTWGATVPDIGHPDRITMDLDPGPGIEWPALVEATRLVKLLLEQLGLAAFLKTTGGKGLHIVAPIEPKRPWPEVKEFTRLMAEMLTRARPDLFLAKMSKAARTGKIFVDYLRNSETASAVAAFSTRARPQAGVSMPLAWDELGERDVREAYTILTVPAALKKRKEDPWKAYASTHQSISDAMIRTVQGKPVRKR
jgi:bifunctional non-homologous end joining protein LigD